MNNVGRNDKCVCGSGKKYKKCCLLKVDQMKQDALELRKSFQAQMDKEWDSWFEKDQAQGQENMKNSITNPEPVAAVGVIDPHGTSLLHNDEL